MSSKNIYCLKSRGTCRNATSIADDANARVSFCIEVHVFVYIMIVLRRHQSALLHHHCFLSAERCTKVSGTRDYWNGTFGYASKTPRYMPKEVRRGLHSCVEMHTVLRQRKAAAAATRLGRK